MGSRWSLSVIVTLARSTETCGVHRRTVRPRVQELMSFLPPRSHSTTCPGGLAGQRPAIPNGRHCGRPHMNCDILWRLLPTNGRFRAVDAFLSERRRSSGNGSAVMTVEFQHFRGAWTTWESLFQDAARFASSLGRERLISISHSEDGSDGVVTVWYWSD